jgi:hypothetical protein
VDDPFGMVVSLLRASTPVTAIVSTRVSSEVMGMPCVQVIDTVSTTRPFGPGSGRMGMQLWMGVARCWADNTPTGAIQARQLAGAVADTLHNLRPTTLGDRYIAKAYTPDIDGISRDPDTRRPFYDVRIEAYAAA